MPNYNGYDDEGLLNASSKVFFPIFYVPVQCDRAAYVPRIIMLYSRDVKSLGERGYSVLRNGRKKPALYSFRISKMNPAAFARGIRDFQNEFEYENACARARSDMLENRGEDRWNRVAGNGQV